MFIVSRAQENPLLSPRPGHPWEAAGVFNWSPIKKGKELVVLYRALSKRELLEEPKVNRSVIGRASSADGVSFSAFAPFITPSEDFDRYGCEDPHVTKIDTTYLTFYTALGSFPFNESNIRVGVALSKDLKTVIEKHLVTPFNAKGMVLFPEKIGGNYVALLTANTERRPSRIAVATFASIEDLWNHKGWNKWYESIDKHSISLHRRDDDHVELGSVPIKTAKGWLVFYSHITHYGGDWRTFGIEAVLLDLKDPRKIVGRTKGALMVPETYYEKMGMVGDVIFPTGAMLRGKFVDIYYGAADTYCCRASIRLDDLLTAMLPDGAELGRRFKNNPLLTAREGVDWEAHGVLNPAAIELDKKIHLLYRAMSSDDTSTFGYAATVDGTTMVERSDAPAYVPRADFESKHQSGNSGCEDPRLILVGNNVVMIYVAYDGHIPRVALTSISKKDFVSKNWSAWKVPTIMTPHSVVNKDAALIPEKTKRGYMFIHRVGESVCADYLPTLDFEKDKVKKCIEIISPRRGMWDGVKVGIAAPPIKTKKGWLLLYHGISETSTYRVGAVLLDLKDPTIVLSRTAVPIFEPKEDYELHGVVGKVVFPCGMVQRGDTLYIYYGGADKVVGGATMSVSKLLSLLS